MVSLPLDTDSRLYLVFILSLVVPVIRGVVQIYKDKKSVLQIINIKLPLGFVILAFVLFILLNQSQPKPSVQSFISESNQVPAQVEDKELPRNLFNASEWDIGEFYSDSDGYLCPFQNGNYYHFVWTKIPVGFVGTKSLKISTKILSQKVSDDIGEVVLKHGKSGRELYEFYFPVRGDKKIKHRYAVLTLEGERELVWSEGKHLFAPVKPNTPLEFNLGVSEPVGSNISAVFSARYIPNEVPSEGGTTKDFSYGYIVDDTSPSYIEEPFAIGVDSNSCVRIETVRID